MSTRRASAFLTLCLIAALVGGCALLPGRIEPPSIHIANIDLLDATLFEQRYVLSLRLQNPNDFDLPIEALSYEIELNDKPFARGVSNKSVTVPPYGSAVLEVEGFSTISDLLRQYKALARGELKGLRYRLSGRLALEGSPARVPFDYQGEIGLPAAEPPRGGEF